MYFCDVRQVVSELHIKTHIVDLTVCGQCRQGGGGRRIPVCEVDVSEGGEDEEGVEPGEREEQHPTPARPALDWPQHLSQPTNYHHHQLLQPAIEQRHLLRPAGQSTVHRRTRCIL